MPSASALTGMLGHRAQVLHGRCVSSASLLFTRRGLDCFAVSKQVGPCGLNRKPFPYRTFSSDADFAKRLLCPGDVYDVFNPRIGMEDGQQPSWVSDLGSFLNAAEKEEINRHCDQLQALWRVEFGVVVLDGLQKDVAPSAFAAALLNYWGIGDPKLHSGLLVLCLVGQRRLEMRVGFGLNRLLTTDVLAATQQNHMVPKMRAGGLGAGLVSGVEALVTEIEARGPKHWRRTSESPVAPNHFGFGGGQTSVEEFMPKETATDATASKER
eukprot:gnl/MRDRNA2_/MRDRNA2_77398_c0_seq3.p1 gnl/MRDRNA2_/MRDRNA2_77398_c0~~gnl/MRDRNA2_/MRDRNA2_77398_c0_seq3.p1  ORF type:complete len:279 (+),score=58.76 gnl/MRDRNA2_/MRDRNA2_77398_c0_seq3:32-838(+)